MIWKARLDKAYQHSPTCIEEITEQKSHKPWDEAVSSPPENVKESGEKRHADNKANRPALQEVRDE